MVIEKKDVFISYSRADYKDENNEPIPNNVISKIISAFERNHITYWIDENGIYTGDNFAPKIAEAIKNASVFVFVSTENSNSSQWTQNEVCVAQAYKKPILPIKCDESNYAVSVIMYLAMLDYCDYKNFPDTAISQLVESVREKLPILPTNKNSVHSRSEEDSIYKEKVINTLSEINHQIVDISQIAVSQILESNERNFIHLCEIANSGIENLSQVEKQQFESLERTIHFHLEEINSNTQERLREISSCFHQLTGHIDHVLSDIRECHKENIERQKRTNDLLEQISSICIELAQRDYSLEKKSQSPRILGGINRTNRWFKENVANMFIVIDVSGSMAGEKIMRLNSAMRGFINEFYHNPSIPSNVEFRLSVLPYSTEAQWQYNTPVDIACYKWIDLESSGLTNLAKPISLLNMKLLDKEVVSSPLLSPLIVFITDGQPTDSYSKEYSLLKSNPVFLSSKCFCICIGSDAHNVIDVAHEFIIGDTSQLNGVLNQILREYIVSVINM